jgi:hypothetical protein
MTLEPSTTPKASGLRTAIDIVISPSEALERIGAVPTWGWAYLIAAILLIAGFLMQHSASTHASIGSVTNQMAHSALYSSLSDEQKQRVIESAKHPPAYQAAIGLIAILIVVLFAALLNSVVLLIPNAIGKGNASFAKLWAGSVNILIPSFGLGSIVLGIICLVRGPEAFDTQMDLLRALPGLGMLAPGTTGLLAGFLSGITIFALWGCFLNVMMLRITAGLKGVLTWIFPVLILVLGALLGGVGAAFSG